MPRPLTLALSTVGVGVLVLLAVLFLKKDRPRPPTPIGEFAPVASPAPPEVAESKPAPSSPVAVRRTPPQPAVQLDAHQPADEASLLGQLHDLAGSNPDLSLKLAREAVKRFPDSPNAPEFEWNVVKALFNLRRLDEAEAEARVMLAKFPGNDFTGDVVHHLLNHPPNPSDAPP